MSAVAILRRLSVAAVIFSLLRHAEAQMSAPHLIPQPRELHATAQIDVRGFSVAPVRGEENRFAAEDLRDDLLQRHIMVTANGQVRISLLSADTPEGRRWLREGGLTFDPAMHDEGYILLSRPHEIAVIGVSPAGVFYGVQTLKQLIDGPDPHSDRVGPARFWTGTIRDWPAMRYRGVHDDLSRGPFPTLTFQKHQIHVFAAYKVNLYSPYFEHTLEHRGQLFTAPPGSSLSEAEAKELAAFAGKYHVMIVPEQEAFGHLHHVLEYDQFADLAETPHGSVLVPGQEGTQQLIYRWFSQIAADFPSPFLHIGADETFDLGKGRTQEEVQKRGLGPVYNIVLARE